MNDAKQLTTEQAVEFHDRGLWKDMTLRERALFQIEQNKLCMPFSEFHKAVEDTLGRPVWTHEFGLNRDGIASELRGEAPAPTFDAILDLLTTTGTPVIVVQT